MCLSIPPLATRVLLPVCLILCLAGLFAATARAQTVDTLVSNTGQSALSGATPSIQAQSFTTGPHGTGYTLSSISLLPFRDFAGDSGTFVAIKEDSAGRPGTLVAALATPDDAYVPGDFFAYAAPANTILQANTTYWIVLNEEQAQSDWQGWGKTASRGEDSTSLPGWSIGNARLQQSGTSWNTAADPLRIDIRGYKNANPTLSIAAASALEGSPVRFAVSLDNATDGVVTVQYDTGDVTAIAGTDYTAASSQTLTIPAGDTVAEFSIATTEDSVDEADETFTVTLSNPSSNADLGTVKSATGTILDGDGKPAVSVAGASATEGANLSFTVSLRFVTDTDVTVEYSTSIGTGDTASASDFTAESGETATIEAGQTETAISIATTQDSIDESDETLTLTISNPSSNAELGTATSATGTIEDDDTAGLVFSAPILGVTEGAGSSYTVALTTKPSATVSVSIAAGGDSGLTLGTSQLSFTPTNWDEPQTVSVSADHDDDASLGSATLTHTASGGDYGSVAATLPVAVTDDDTPAIVLSQTALPVPEDGSATYTVALATLPTEKVTLELAGTAGTDLTVAPSAIEFEPGDWDTPVTVTVEAAADLDADNDPETLTYTASGGDYGGVSASVAVEVVDTVAASIVLNKTRLHVKEGGAAVAYRVALGLQPASDVTVQVTRVNGAPLFIGTSSASGQSATLTFTPDNWDQSQRIVVAASSNVVTGNREHELRHRAAGGGYGSAPVVDLPVLIEDENAQKSYVFSETALSLAEDGTTSYTLKLGKRPSANLGVTIAGGGSSLTVEPDSLSFTRDNWNDGQTVTVTAAAQVSAQDATKTLTHTGDGGGYDSGALAAGELPVTIVRDVPKIADTGGVTVTSRPLHTGNTYASGETIALSVKFDRDVVVDTGNGSPHLEVDIGSSSRNVGYAGMAGNRTLTFEYVVQSGDLDSDGISVGDDALALNGATIRAGADQRDAELGGTALSTQGGHRVDGSQTLAAATLASLGLAHGTTSLDLTPPFASGTTAYEATVSASVEFVTVSASAAGGGNARILPADADSNATGHQVRIDGAETEITVTAVRAPRPDGTYTLTVSQVRPSVSIAADVSTLAFHLQGFTLTVTRAAATAEALAVNLAFTQDQDFLPSSKLSRTVTIPANQTSATLTLEPGDFTGGATADGTLTASIASHSTYAIGSDGSASVAMVAADPAITVRPSSAAHVFPEDSGTHSIGFVAETAAGVPEPAGISFRLIVSTQNGTAVGNLDYEALGTSFVSFQASDFAAQDGRYVATKSVDVTLTDDDLVEGNEGFSLRLIKNNFPAAVALAGSDGSTCGTVCAWNIVIVDDDSPPAQVTGVALTPAGGSLGVSWDGVLGADGYKVQWKSGDQTFATASSDGREASISSGSTTSHTIPSLTDGTDYTVRVLAVRGSLEGAWSTEVAGRPDLPTLTVAAASATEGAAVEFTVSLSRAAASAVMVQYDTSIESGDTASADDFTAASGETLTIDAGQTSGTASIATTGDTADEDDETFTLTLSNPSSNAVLGTARSATGTIVDDDVTAASVASVTFTDVPSSGSYGLGDSIEVSVTFDAAVDVTGTPRVGLSMDGTDASASYAAYDAGASSATVLVFRKTVTAADDDDTDGIGVPDDALELNGGSIVNQGTAVAAALGHAAVSNGATVATRWIEGIAVTSTPTVPETVTGDPIYGPGETVRLTVTFENAVTVDTASGTPALKIVAGSGGRQDAEYESGSGSTALVFAWAVPAAVAGDGTPIGVPSNTAADRTLLTNGGLVLNGGTIEDAGARAVNVRHGSYATDSLVDTTGPVVATGPAGAVVDATELVLSFERASGVPDHLDEDSEPAPGDFTVTVLSVGTRTVSGVDVDSATVTLALASPVGHAQTVTVGYAPGTDRIKDRWGNEAAGFSGRAVRNDSPEPTLSIASVTVDEDDGAAAFAVTLDVASGEEVTVDYATSDVTTTGGSDYTAASGTLRFAAGDTSETITVTLGDDALSEGDETFKVTLSNAANASIANGEATGTITDDEGTPTVTIADASATEGDAVEFAVTLSPASQTDVTVQYATTDGSATADSAHADGADYTAPASNATLTIAAGKTSETISVATGDDTADEDDETFTLTLSGPSSNAALGSPKTATGTIEDDDTDPAVVTNVAFTSRPSNNVYDLGDVIEVSVTFDIAVEVGGTPRVKLYFIDAHRLNEYAYYDAASSTERVLVFKRVVTGNDDDDSSVRVATNGLQRNGGTIRNKGTTVDARLDHAFHSSGLSLDTRWVKSVAVTSTPTVPETVTGDPVYGPGETVRFTVTFENAVDVDETNGTPALKFRSGSDSTVHTAPYESGTGTTALVFAWTVPAQVPGDGAALVVPTNVRGIGLNGSSGLTLGGGTIENDDGIAVNIRHRQRTAAARVDTTGPVLASAADGATVDGTELVLAFERASGVAEHLNENSAPAPGAFQVAVAGASRSVTGVDVDGATVTLTLVSPVGHAQTVTVGYTPGTDRIKDRWGNEAAQFTGRTVRNGSPEPAISIASATAAENAGKVAFAVTLDVASGEAAAVDYVTSDDTAEAGSDYTAASGTLEFAVGETAKTIEVALVDDSVGEGNETFKVTLSNASNATLAAAMATGTITDDETPTLTIANASATEGDAVEFTVTLDPVASRDVTVQYGTSDGTATSDSQHEDGADYTAPAGGATLTISAGQASKTVSISTGSDTAHEDDETFTLTLSNPSSNAALGTPKTATGTILNDDAASTDASLTSLTVKVGSSDVALTPAFASGTYSYEGEVENTAATVSVAVATSHRKARVAIAGDDDTSTPNQADLAMAFGENTVTVTVTAEDGETEQAYTIELTRAAPVIEWEHTGLYKGEDAGDVEIGVILTPALGEAVSVDYATLSSSHGLPGEDYTPVSDTLTFAPGETRKTFTLSILDDSVYEPAGAGNVTLALSNPTDPAVFGINGTILVVLVGPDNESPPTATMEDVSVDEDAGTMTFVLELSHPVEGEVVYRTQSNRVQGTATAVADYERFVEFGVDADISIPSRQTSASFQVTIVDDDIDEEDETLAIDWRLSWSGVAPTATNAVNVTGTIVDDDTRGVTVSQTALPVPEGDTATYTVVLDSEPTGTVTVTPSRTSGDTDVTVSGALTFTPSTWDTEQTVTVSAAEDADAVNDTATVSHAVAGADYGSETASDVAVTVADDEAAPDIPGRVTGLTTDATASRVALSWTAPSPGTVVGYRVEASYDGGSSWAEVMADTGGTGTAYTHRSGLMAGETRHYRVSAIFGGGGGTGPASDAAEANATIAVGGLTVTGLAVEDAPHGMPTVDLCWKPTDVAASDLGSFAIQKRKLHPSMPGEWSDEVFSPWSPSDAADCEAGSIGLRVSSGIVANVRYAFRMRARHGGGWALSNDAEAASVDMARDVRTEVMAGNSGEAGDTEVPATVCRDYDDPATPENDAGTFIVNIGFTTGPELFLYYEEVDGFVLGDDVTLVNASAQLIDRPYSRNLGYRIRVTPTDWGQPVTVSVPAGAATHAETGTPNLASNVFRRNTSDSTDCDASSTATLYRPLIRTVEILDDDDRNGNWAAGEHVGVAIDFREDVVVATEGGVPSVTLTVDGETVQAPYARGSGGETLVFEHAVTAAQSPVYSVAVLADSLTLNGGTIGSPNGPSAQLGHAGATKESRRPPPPTPGPSLTAQWAKFPPGHSGDGMKFVVRVKFSEPVTVSARSLRNHALTVTDGVIDGLWQVANGSGEKKGDLWAIRVMPTSTRPLALTLAATPDCAAQGAICTADKRPLSRSISLSVPGPGHEITVADAEVQEGPGAALGFVVTLSGTAPYRVKVDYRTADGTATAGLDYTAVSGRLIFERGETSKTVSVPVLDDTIDDDGETLTLVLSNPKRAMIVDGEAVGTIRNSDAMPQAWLARLGRTVADQVLAAVEDRLASAPVAETELSIAGQRVDGSAASDDAEAREAEAGLETLAGWLGGGSDEDEARGFTSRQVTGRDLLTGTSFTLTGRTAEDGVTAVWGRGTVGRFHGREGALALDGEVLSSMLGADWTQGAGTAGVLIAHSRGEGGFQAESGGGEVSSTLTGVYPYGRLALNERVSLWGVSGYGAGTLALKPEGSASLDADIDLAMAAAGVRGVVRDGGDGGATVALTADGMIVRTGSESIAGLTSSTADVTRLRLGIEGSRPLPLKGGALLTPSVEIGLRLDGGDAETGLGADTGAAIVWEEPARGLRAEVRGRGLLTHADGHLRERGFAGSLVWNPTPASGLGPSLTVRQTIGASPSGGMDALLSRETLAGLAANDNGADSARRFEVTLGYGLPVPGGRFIGTPEIGLGLTDVGREYRLGWGLGLARHGRASLDLGLEGTLHESANEDREPEHRIGFTLRARW